MHPVLLLLQLLSLSSRSVQSQQRVLCVKTGTSHITEYDLMHNNIMCQTLDWYIRKQNNTFTSGTKLLFQEGVHSLNAFLKVSNIHNFTLAGNGSAVRIGNSPPQPTTRIRCSDEDSSDSGLYFSECSNVQIYNIELDSCSGVYTTSKHIHVSASGLVFKLVHNVSLKEVLVNNTKGFGIYIYNIFGRNIVSDSAFIHASYHPNANESGNADIFFDKFINSGTQLVINSSWFMYGQNGRRAGGLNIHLHCTNVNVVFENMKAQGNTGHLGGNVWVFMTLFATNSSKLVISNSRITDGRALKGAGMRFVSNTKSDSTGSFTLQTQLILSINHTLFHGNIGAVTGGAMYLAFMHTLEEVASVGSYVVRLVKIINCSFDDNGGDGAVMEVKQFGLYVVIPMFKVSLERCSFENNFLLAGSLGSMLDFVSCEISIIDSTFIGSNSTAVSIRDSYLNLVGDILFENNTAKIGGALKICGSSLVFAHNGTRVSFVNNSAEKGGAIYVQQYCMDTLPLCFIQPSFPRNTRLEDLIKVIDIKFLYNTGEIAGDALYGGDVYQCSLVNYFHSGISKIFFDGILDFQKAQGSSLISSDPRGICFCIMPKYICRSNLRLPDKYPGEIIVVSVITVGQLNGSTSGIIQGELINKDNDNHTLVRFDNPELSSQCVNFNFTLKSNRMHATVTLKPVASDYPAIFNNIHPNLTVEFRQCPRGFKLTDSPPYECECHPILSKYLVPDSQVTCNITNRSISVQQRRLWLGCLDTHSNNTILCDSLAVSHDCDYYCNTVNSTANSFVHVSIVNLDSQCLPGHTGILCGACKPGYSRVFGALECQNNCTNSNLPVLILSFFAFGVILIIFIMVLNLTVTEGTLNGLLVYTMIIQTHRSYFPDELSGFGRACWVFISWINLSVGTKICVYKEMDAYQQVWAIFVQAFYIFLILFVIILLSRRYILCTRLFGRNIVKVLATVVVLLHFNLSSAILASFRFTTLHMSSPNNTRHTKIVWYQDAKYHTSESNILFYLLLLCFVLL